MPVLAAYADAQHEPPRRQPGEVGELAGDEHRVAQWQQVDADMHVQRGVQHGQRGGLHDPVEPDPGHEADVVAAADVVDAGVRRPGQVRSGRLLPPVHHAERREQADPQHGARHGSGARRRGNGISAGTLAR